MSDQKDRLEPLGDGSGVQESEFLRGYRAALRDLVGWTTNNPWLGAGIAHAGTYTCVCGFMVPIGNVHHCPSTARVVRP